MRDFKNKHFYYAQLPPLFIYFIFSFIGWGLHDSGTILIASISVKEGLIPYTDFHFIVTPLTLYTQAAFQKIFPFLHPVLISVLWKGLSYSILSLISSFYLINMLQKLKVIIKFPTTFIYLYPLLFMSLGPIHETHLGYTSDALLFACLGILFLTWSDNISKRDIITYLPYYFGYLLLGISFGYKQEIGFVAILCGLLYLIILIFVLNCNNKFNIIWDAFIPLFLLVLAPLILFGFFYLKSSLNAMIYSILIVPSTIKANKLDVFVDLMTFGQGINKTIVIIFVLIFSFLILLHEYNKYKNHISLTSNYITKVQKTLWYVIIVVSISLSSFLLWNENYALHNFHSQPIGVLEYFYVIHRFTYFLILFAFLTLFIFSIIKLKHNNYLNSNWIFNYALPVFLLLLIFDASLVAGTNGIRLHRIFAPLFIGINIISLMYLTRPMNRFNISRKQIYGLMYIIIIIFISARMTGVFSAILADPIHNKVSYSEELYCFIDDDVYKNLIDIKQIVNNDNNDRNVFVYQSDPMLYIFLSKKPISYSYGHFIDWYPHSLDQKEINNLKSSDVNYIITQSNHKREDSFLFRKNDPIRDYIELKYKIILTGEYYYLWEKY